MSLANEQDAYLLVLERNNLKAEVLSLKYQVEIYKSALQKIANPIVDGRSSWRDYELRQFAREALALMGPDDNTYI